MGQRSLFQRIVSKYTVYYHLTKKVKSCRKVFMQQLYRLLYVLQIIYSSNIIDSTVLSISKFYRDERWLP